MPPAIYKSKILLVEDHEDTSELMRLLLQQMNYEVATSASIAAALNLAASSHFDLFVLDSLLPDGTGTELCQRIRQRDNSTPILFYSAQAYEHDKQEALSAGAQKYLVKPVDFGVFCKAVTELLSASMQRQVSA